MILALAAFTSIVLADPAIPPRFVGEPRRVERQFDIASIINGFKSVAAIPGNVIQGFGKVASAVPVAVINTGANLATVPLSIFQSVANATANTAGQLVSGLQNATGNSTG